MDLEKYRRYTDDKEREFETICRRCGKCCGVLDDPCQNLVKVDAGRYFCRDYNGRLGLQRTSSGSVFNCVPIREHISRGTLRQDCVYNDL